MTTLITIGMIVALVLLLLAASIMFLLAMNDRQTWWDYDRYD